MKLLIGESAEKALKFPVDIILQEKGKLKSYRSYCLCLNSYQTHVVAEPFIQGICVL